MSNRPRRAIRIQDLAHQLLVPEAVRKEHALLFPNVAADWRVFWYTKTKYSYVASDGDHTLAEYDVLKDGTVKATTASKTLH